MPHLEHIGLAVKDPEAVARLLDQLLGTRVYKRESVSREGVQTHFLTADTAKVELLESLEDGSPIAKFLAKRGEGLHHLAFEVDDIHAAMQRLRRLGFDPLTETPRPGADGKLIFFLHPKQTHGVLIEFCQSTPQALQPACVPYRDGHLAVYERGDRRNPTLLLLHGAAGATMLETAPLLSWLEPYFHLLALDFPGHGASDVFPSLPFTIPLFADNVRAVLDFFALEQAHLFGFSMGGSVALYVARHTPGRVHRLVLHATNIFWEASLVEAMIKQLDVDALRARKPAWFDRLQQTHGPAQWDALYQRMLAFTRSLPHTPALREGDLKRIFQPTLVTAGDRDALFGLETTLRLYRTLPAGNLAVLPGVGHAMHHLDLHGYARLLRNHLTTAP